MSDKLRVAIVDDERETAEQIRGFLQRFRREQRTDVAEDVFCDAASFVAGYHSNYDLILFDVEMPGMNGIEAARQIRQRDGKVVIMFITNMAQYAIRGYEVEAVDYVIKPIGYQDFAMKMKKAIRYVERAVGSRYAIHTPSGTVVVQISDIFYVEVVRHYLHFHTAAGVYEMRGVMRELEEEFRGYHFVRCSQSFLVNLGHVKAINGSDVTVGGDELSISRNRKNDFITAFTRYVGGMDS